METALLRGRYTREERCYFLEIKTCRKRTNVIWFYVKILRVVIVLVKDYSVGINFNARRGGREMSAKTQIL